MNRRSFLRGMLVSATAGTALVKLASAEETHFLSTTAPIAVGNLEPEIYPPDWQGSPEVYMRIHGKFVAVGLLHQLTITQGVMEATSWEGHAVMVPGLKRGDFSFRGER